MLFKWFNRTKKSQKQAKIDIWKFSPQNHISFYKVFFDKKHSPPPPKKKANICDKDSLRTTRHSFFSDSPLFKIWDWRLSPTSRKGGTNTVKSLCKCFGRQAEGNADVTDEYWCAQSGDISHKPKKLFHCLG